MPPLEHIVQSIFPEVETAASCTSSSQNVPLISGLPGTRITLKVISRASGPVTKWTTCCRHRPRGLPSRLGRTQQSPVASSATVVPPTFLGACRYEAGGRQTLKGVNVCGIPPCQGRESGGTQLQAPLGVHQFNTTLCPAVTVAGRMLLPSLTEYFPAGKETGWLTCLDASCVPEASSTA
jgi:hypothetical protein